MAIRTVTRSLRVNDDDSAHLSRTPGGAGSQTTWTWSGWVKRCSFAADMYFFTAAPAGHSTNPAITQVGFNSLDQFIFFSINNPTVHWSLVTSNVFRDPTAWYHIVVVLNTTHATASNRARIYINGTEITSWADNTLPALNATGYVNQTVSHVIGREAVRNRYQLDGYLAEVHFLDGQALTPSDFGETDPVTGQWLPKETSFTSVQYGVNGFYLPFTNNTSTTTLGNDTAPTGTGHTAANNWTLNNFSVAAGAGNDSLLDTPSNNYCVLNNITKSTSTNAPSANNGGLDYATPAGVNTTGWPLILGTHGVNSGKWYFEVDVSGIGADAVIMSGWCTPDIVNDSDNTDQFSKIYGFVIRNDSVNTGLRSAVGATWTTRDGADATDACYQLAFDFDAGKFWVGKNNTWYASGNPSAGTNEIGTFTAGLTMLPIAMCQKGGPTGDSTQSYNFGQRAFTYTPPTGFLALNTANLSAPTITQPKNYFDVLLHTGTGASKNVVGLSFAPDLVLSKNRSASQDVAIFDRVRARYENMRSYLSSNATSGQRVFLGNHQIDASIDTPLNNFCTWNPLSTVTTGTLSNGNLDTTGTAIGTIAATLFDTYWEITAHASGVTAGVQGEFGTGGRTVSVPLGKTYGFRITTQGQLDYRNITDVGGWISSGGTLSGTMFPYVTGGSASGNFGQRTFLGSDFESAAGAPFNHGLSANGLTSSPTVGTPAVSLPITYTQTTNITTGGNIFTLMGSPAGVGEYIFTINSGVSISSNSTATPGLTTGTFPVGSTLRIVNNGYIYGMGGAGGRGDSGTANHAAGAAGGNALNLGMNVSIDNTSGNIWGGGGGGGGRDDESGGHGGGGGASGLTSSAGGIAGWDANLGVSGLAGGVGTSSGPGAGGTSSSGTAGAGGAHGAVGGTGTLGGGAAGKAVNRNGFAVTWLGGNNATQVKGADS